MVGALLLAAAATWVGGDPQVQYDYARDLEESVAGRVDVCAVRTRAYVHALVEEAEGLDRLKPSLQRAAHVRAARAKRRLRGDCEREHARVVPELEQPRSGEASFGTAVVNVPPGSTGVDVTVNDRLVFQKHKGGPARLVFTLRLPPGQYTLRARFSPRGEQVSRDVWLLRASRDDARFPEQDVDPRLERAGSTFRGWAGIWTHDLRTGRAAGWNEKAAFPAASTVKLGVLVAALRNYGAPSVVSYDLHALTSWSSNLAANRLYRLLGWSRVRDGLYALGMDASTYTGPYRVGTALGSPPRVSGRVTTARDLGRALFRLHAAALGLRFALASTKLSRHEARVALGYLLSFDRTDANRGLLPLRTPTAEKNGWLNDALHTAAIVYGSNGPKIVVVLTYRSGLRMRDARALGARVYDITQP